MNINPDETLGKRMTGTVPYHFTETLRTEHPELVSDIGSSFDLRTNTLDKLYNKLFFDEKPSKNSAGIYGIARKKRSLLWIEEKYLETPDNYSKYKVLLPKAIGSGNYGERMPEFIIAEKGIGHTQSFVSIGDFDTKDEANNLIKYLNSKFLRALLGILKVTQDVTPRVFGLVPIIDFSSSSEIDWSQSISEIDIQLYSKYGLSNEEINFIESHVKEMS